MGPLTAIADGLSGHTAGHGDHADRDAISGGHTALTHIGDFRAFRLYGSQLRRITENHTIRKPRRDLGLLALVLA